MCGSKRVWVSELIFILFVVKGWWSEGCLEQEKSALLQLRHFFNDDHRLRKGADAGDDENYSDCCQWEGVECNNTTGRVIKLDLAFRKWESAEWYMNASLFTPFQQLESLDLIGNNIAGCVENEGLDRLSRLNNLKFLFLDDNNFNNNIFSSLGGLSSLRDLSLAGNGLNGSIDIKGLDSLSNLEELDMSFNAIDNLVVPKGLERLSRLNNLKFLYLDDNHFNNSIFSSLGGLSSLIHLSLVGNRLNGSIDIKGLNSLSNLEELDMRANAIDNLVVPKDLRGLRKLNILRLGGTEIAMMDGSKVLQSIGSLPSLKTLYLSYTNFTGTVINQELHNLTNLEELILDESDLHVSQLLQSIASFTSLKYLSMQDSVLKGALHGQDFRKFKNLENLDMGEVQVDVNTSFLQIVGESMPSLKFLSLTYSSLNKNTILDQGLNSLSNLEELDMSNNAIDKLVVPKDFRGLRKLNTLRLGRPEIAMIDGSKVLQSIGSLPSLKTLYLSYTNFTGTVVNQELHNFTNLEELILDKSDLHVSQLLSSIASFTSLKYLSMQDSVFKGALHGQDFRKFKNLEHLDMGWVQVNVK